MAKKKINYYTVAPTWLFNLRGETRLFETQEEVDMAWEEGWFGPSNLAKQAPLLSTLEWESKEKMADAVEGDPRYPGLKLSMRKSKDNLLLELMEFEEESGLIGKVKAED